MKWNLATLLFVFLMLFASSSLHSAASEGSGGKSIPVGVLNEIKVVGMTGLALGQVAELEATIISGDETGKKADQGKYLFKLVSIAGKPLAEPLIMPFRGEAGLAGVFPRDAFELHKQTLAKEADTIPADLLMKLEKDYVGTKVRFLGYESGRFDGIPNGLPKDHPVRQGKEFGFKSELIVVKKL